MNQNHSEQVNQDKGLPEVPEVTGSMVYRIESLLAGKDFDEMEKIVNGLYDTYNAFYRQCISYLGDKYFSMPPATEDEDYMAYTEDLKLLQKPVKELDEAERAHIVDLFNLAVQHIDELKEEALREGLPVKRMFEEEEFSYESIKSEYLMERIITRLRPIMVMPEREKIADKIDRYSRQIEINEDNKANKYCLAVSRKVFFERYDEVKEICERIKQRGKKVELVIDNYNENWEGNSFQTRIPYSYSEEEMKQIFDFYRFHRRADAIYFSEFYTENFIPIHRDELWTFEEVAFSNYKKQEYLKYLKQLKLSAFPQVLAIHKHVTNRQYSGFATSDEKTRTFLTAEESESKEDEDNLISQGKAFVCSSVASYAKAFIDDLHDPNLQCKLVAISYYDPVSMEKRSDACHMMLLVKIKDENYGIDGYYLWDPTVDLEGIGYANCLFPVTDLDKALKLVVVDELENSSKKEAFLQPKREGRIKTKYLSNIGFNNRYSTHSDPIPLIKVEEALKEVYTKMKTARGVTYEEDERVAQNDPLDLVLQDFNTTLRFLDLYSPRTAQAAFYKEMREYYMKSDDPSFANWEEDWLGLNSNMSFTREDFLQKNDE